MAIKLPPATIPVVLLTGFLGSGKTTLLNGLLRQRELGRTAVIVNELGTIAVDQLLVADVADNIVTLASGCLCCSLSNSFRETLLDLHARRAAGTVPPFERVVVETTGLADPAPILQTLLRDPLVAPLFTVDAVVTTVDALLGLTVLADFTEAQKQIALADRIVVTKTDLTGGECPSPLRSALQELNAVASIVMVSGGEVDAGLLLGGARIPQPPTSLHFSTAQHTHGIRADAFVIVEPATWSGIAAWLDACREFFGPRLLRCKGVLWVQEAQRPVLIQGVQAVFAPCVTLPGWPDADHRSRLVCISRGLDESTLRKSLSLLRAVPGTYRPATLEELTE